MLRGLFEGNLDATERHMRIVWPCAVSSVTAEDYTLKSLVFHTCSGIGPHISVITLNLIIRPNLSIQIIFSKLLGYSRGIMERTAKTMSSQKMSTIFISNSNVETK